jgi:hypothetical protein
VIVEVNGRVTQMTLLTYFLFLFYFAIRNIMLLRVNENIEHIWQLKLCYYENLATFTDIGELKMYFCSHKEWFKNLNMKYAMSSVSVGGPIQLVLDVSSRRGTRCIRSTQKRKEKKRKEKVEEKKTGMRCQLLACQDATNSKQQ